MGRNALRVALTETWLTVYCQRRVRSFKLRIRIFAIESKSLPKDWCQNFCNPIVFRGIKPPDKNENLDEKMSIFVKFTKAIFGPQKQSPGLKSIKNKLNLSLQ